MYVVGGLKAKPILSDKNVKELADPRLEDNYDPTEMDRAMVTASKCIHHTASFRPYMNQVIKIKLKATIALLFL